MALSLTLVPGKVWSANEPLTTASLNAAANPTVNLAGSISTQAIADGSVTTSKLADGCLATSAPQKMQNAFIVNSHLSAGCVDSTKLDLATQGSVQQYATASSGGVGTAYATTLSPAPSGLTAGMRVVFVADVTNTASPTLNVNGLGAKNLLSRGGLALVAFQIQANELVECHYDGTSFRCVGIASRFVSAETALGSATQILSAAHGLGVVPTRMRGVLRCKTAEGGYSIGDEVELAAAVTSLVTNTNEQVFAIAANATNVYGLEIYTSFLLPRRDTAVFFAATNANWKLVVYAER